jgi:DNA replication protein DnaC
MTKQAMELRNQKVPAEYSGAEVSPGIKAKIPKDWQSLLLIGPAGTGKTTQLWALHRKHVTGKELTGRHKVHVISECSDIDRYRYDWDWLNAWAQFPGLLCVDDIGYRSPKDWTCQAIYHLATYRRAHQLRVIWTSNLTLDRLREAYGDPIASRLTGGTVIQTGGPDKRQA